MEGIIYLKYKYNKMWKLIGGLMTSNKARLVVIVCFILNKIFDSKIVNIFLSISFKICFGCSKEPSH